MSKKEIEHFDKLGDRLNINDVVAVAHHNSLMIAKVIKITPKMIRIKNFKKSRWDDGEHNKYSSDAVKIQESAALIYILKNI